MPILEIRALRAWRADREAQTCALESLVLEEGEIGAVLWGNHAGRQALLRHLAEPTAPPAAGWRFDGNVTINRSVDIPNGRQRRSLLLLRNPESQFSGCFQRVLLEFSLPLALRGQSAAEQRIIAGFWLSACGLGHLGSASADQLSTGQKQRLLLASALATAPSVLLLDSPMEFIDPLARCQLLALVKHICVAQKFAVLLGAASTDHVVLDLCDKVAAVSEPRSSPRPAPPALALPSSPGKTRECIRVQSLRYLVPQNGDALYHGLTFSVREASSVALIGPNGSGKSTIGHLLGGRLLPSDGSLEVCGVKANSWFERRQPQIACSFTDPDLTLTKRTVRLEIDSVPSGLLSDKSNNHIISLLGLDQWLDANPFDLDWHVRRSISIAKAIKAARTAVFIDEPSADASPEEYLCLRAVLELCLQSGLAVIVATNDELLAEQVAFEQVIRLSPAEHRTEAAESAIPGSLRPGQEAIPFPDSTIGSEVAKWAPAIWRSTVSAWFDRAPEFSAFWESVVYPCLLSTLSKVGLSEPFAMVDLGCGSGLHTINVATILRKMGAPLVQVLGVDVERAFIDVANTMFGADSDVTFRALDLTDLGLVEGLVADLKERQLPLLFTAFFSLHDFASLDGVQNLLAGTRGLGGALIGLLLSPDEVARSSEKVRRGNYRRNTEEGGTLLAAGDWDWYGLYPASVEESRPLLVPYFHRQKSQYEALLNARWGSCYSLACGRMGGGSAARSMALATFGHLSREDEVLLLWTQYSRGE